MAGARLSAEQQAALTRQMSREKESGEQKWLRGAIREELAELLDEYFTGEGEEGGENGGGRGGPKNNKGGGFLEGLLGSTGS